MKSPSGSRTGAAFPNMAPIAPQPQVGGADVLATVVTGLAGFQARRSDVVAAGRGTTRSKPAPR